MTLEVIVHFRCIYSEYRKIADEPSFPTDSVPEALHFVAKKDKCMSLALYSSMAATPTLLINMVSCERGSEAMT